MRIMMMMDGMAKVLDVTNVASMSQEEMLEIMKGQLKNEPVFVPHANFGCAMAIRDAQRSAFLMYIAPNIRRNVMFESLDSGRVMTASLWLPHIYIMATFRRNAFERGYAYMAHDMIRKSADRVTIAPLPNVDENGLICNGNAAAFSIDNPPEVNAEQYVRFFLQSHFSNDIQTGFGRLPEQLKDTTAVRDGVFDKVFEKWTEGSASMTRDQALAAYASVNLDRSIEDVISRNMRR